MPGDSGSGRCPANARDRQSNPISLRFVRRDCRVRKETEIVKQFVKQWWTTRCGRFMRLFAKADEGSGTVSGIALIAATAVMLGVVAATGNLLICLHRAQHVADLAAVASATALHEGSAVPCEWLRERRAVMAPSCNPAKSSEKMHESQSQWVRTCRLRLR